MDYCDIWSITIYIDWLKNVFIAGRRQPHPLPNPCWLSLGQIYFFPKPPALLYWFVHIPQDHPSICTMARRFATSPMTKSRESGRYQETGQYTRRDKRSHNKATSSRRTTSYHKLGLCSQPSTSTKGPWVPSSAQQCPTSCDWSISVDAVGQRHSRSPDLTLTWHPWDIIYDYLKH